MDIAIGSSGANECNPTEGTENQGFSYSLTHSTTLGDMGANGSGGWDRTYGSGLDPQLVAGQVSATVSNEVFEVGHIPASDRRLLARVVEAWPELNGSLKVAILAIVEGSAGR